MRHKRIQLLPTTIGVAFQVSTVQTSPSNSEIARQSAGSSYQRTSWKKRLWKCLKRALLVLPFLWFLPVATLLYATLGAVDLRRNKVRSWTTVNRYFFGNGILTWLLSPINLLLDLVCLPYRNIGIYRLEDLPESYSKEIMFLVDYARTQGLASRVAEHIQSERRGMMMFKWYGKNFETSLAMPEFHRTFLNVQTIGVSVFNKKQSTSLHFGPLRATLRVLYNINQVTSREAYIDVGENRHYWMDEKLFIFDDTLEHRSVNESDALRVCLFVDVIRPSLFPSLLRLIVLLVQKLSFPMRKLFYKNWSFLK